MLLNFGKIKSINGDHPILKPSLDVPMDFYSGHYYVKEPIVMTDGKGYTIEPGFLEVYISYSTAYEEGSNTEYYINYKHVTNDGKIYNWRYYLHKEEETIYRLDKNDAPNLVLTKSKIDDLLYNEQEMSERFLSKVNSNLNKENYFIRIPRVKSRTINSIDANGRFSGNKLFKDDNITTTELNNGYGFNKLFRLFSDRSMYIDDNLHPYEKFENRWVDLFNLGSTGLWDEAYNKGLKVSNANGKFYPSHRQVYGINPNINTIYAKLGEYFTDFGILSSTGEYHIYTIDENTYLPGISYTRNTSNPPISEEVHPRNYYNMEESPFYMVRMLTTPDEDISNNPIVFYGANTSQPIVENTYNPKYETVNPFTNKDIYRERLESPRQWSMGLLFTSVQKKNSLEVLYENSVNNVESVLYNYTRYNKDNDWGTYHINSRTNSNLTDDLHIQLFDVDPYKVFYRSHSSDVDNSNYIDNMTNRVNNEDIVTDIRLGPETRTTYDKSDVNLNSPDRFINIVNEDPAMILTYFKVEINKRSPRYTLEKQSLSYELAYPEQQTFLQRMNRRLELKANEKLAIDKITVGFRPLQVKVNNVWKNIQKKGVGR